MIIHKGIKKNSRLRVNHTIKHNQHNQAQSYTIAQSHNQNANFRTIAQSKCKFLHNRTIKMQVFAQSHNQYQNFENIPTISRRYCTINKETLKILPWQPTLQLQSNTIKHNRTITQSHNRTIAQSIFEILKTIWV